MKIEKTFEKKMPNSSDNELEILKQVFPQYFDKSGKFLLEKFNKSIKEKTDISKESYSLEWLGKRYAKVLASEPVRTLIKENIAWNEKEENTNSQNLLIKGDNLEVLKHMVYAYKEKVKMIYIDPPYNTGNDEFVYQDDRKFTVEELSKLAGISEEKAKRILEFVNSKSNSHSAWLTFMYPRLYIARKLLRDDGVIFVSIDEHEIAQLRLLMDEIFGEENFAGQITVVNNLKGRSDDSFFATCNEYILVYGKEISKLKIQGFYITEEEIENEYKKEDEFGAYKLIGFRKTGKGWQREHRPKMYYPVLEKEGKFFALKKEEYDLIFNEEDKKFNDSYVEELITKYETKGFNVYLPLNSKGEKGRWRWGYKNYLLEKDKNLAINDKNNVCTKMRPFLEDGSLRFKLSKTTWYKGEYDTGSSSKYLKKIFNTTYDIFENPKSVLFIKDILTISTKRDDIVLDFFAGSGTTGDAVMQLNAEDGGNRKYILVQLPEPIDPKKNKTAYDFVKNELGVENPTIFDITKERLVRAAQKIRENSDRDLSDMDFGFKIFETIDLPQEYLKDIDEIEDNTTLINPDFDINSLLTTWKLDDGFEFTKEATKVDLDGYDAFLMDEVLYLLNDNFTTGNLTSMLRKIDEDKSFTPVKIVANGYAFNSKAQREIDEAIKNFVNRKRINNLDFIVRY